MATRAPLIGKSDGLVDFERGATEIANRLRAFSPWPGLRFVHEGRSIKILSALPRETSEPPSAPAGSIQALSPGGLDVVCGAGSILRLMRVQPESRGPMSAFDFANGARLGSGMVFAAAPQSRSGESRD
jgi:methionyl-tRNA formyltransferase